jgi:hypothetical protein
MSEAVEALKISLKQEADGIIVAFRIHPDDLPTDLLRARINSRFALAFQQISDDEKPMPSAEHPIMKAVEKKRKQNANVMRAGMACAEPKFQHFLKQAYPNEWKQCVGPANAKASSVLRLVTDIESRRDLATDQEGLRKFDALMGRYEMWKRGE